MGQHCPVFSHLPLHAVWRHIGGPDGYECAFFRVEDDLLVVEGQTIALDDDDVWSVGYSIRIDDSWRMLDARLAVRTARGVEVVGLERAGSRWFVDGQHEPLLDGCDDLELEASACTNTFPVHRLALPVGEHARGGGLRGRTRASCRPAGAGLRAPRRPRRWQPLPLPRAAGLVRDGGPLRRVGPRRRVPHGRRTGPLELGEVDRDREGTLAPRHQLTLVARLVLLEHDRATRGGPRRGRSRRGRAASWVTLSMRTRTDGFDLQVAHPVGLLTRTREHEDRVLLTHVPDLDLVVGPGDAPAGREVAVVVARVPPSAGWRSSDPGSGSSTGAVSRRFATMATNMAAAATAYAAQPTQNDTEIPKNSAMHHRRAPTRTPTWRR